MEIVEELLPSKMDELQINDDSVRTCLQNEMSSCPLRPDVEATIECVLNSGSVDINQTDAMKKSFLHYAIHKSKSSKLIKCLLAFEGINANVQDINGKTPLHYACMRSDRHELAKMLLCHDKVDVNIVDKAKKTALHHASSISGCEKTLKMLLDRPDINVHHVDESGKTVLHYCCIEGHGVDIVEKILQHVDNNWITKVDHDGKVAHHYANINEHKHIYTLLSNVSDVSSK